MDLISATSLETIAKLLLPIILFMMFIVFWWRAGSIHSIMERLWRITAGKTPIKNRELAEFIEKNREIEKFRFIYRLKIKHHEDLQRFLRWHKTHGYPIQDIQFLRHWFDVDDPDFIKPPKKIFLWFPGICTLIFLAMLLGFVSIGASPKAYLQMKASGANFKSDGLTIETWFGNWKADSSNCNKKDTIFINKFEFNEDEEKTICAAFQDGSLKSTFESALKSQRTIGMTFGLIFGALFLYAFRELATTLDAIRFPARLEKFKNKKIRSIQPKRESSGVI